MITLHQHPYDPSPRAVCGHATRTDHTVVSVAFCALTSWRWNVTHWAHDDEVIAERDFNDRTKALAYAASLLV